MLSPTGRQSLKIALSSPSSAKSFRLRMSDSPTGSETKPVEPEPVEPEPAVVEEFRKNKSKREAKRKTYVPEIAPPPPPATTIDAESIADRVAEILLSKMGTEEDDDEPPPVKTKAKPAPPRPKKEVAPPPPTKSFGWC